MDKAQLDAYQDVTCSQIDKMKAAAGLTGRQVWNRSVLKCNVYVTYRKDPDLEELVRRGLMEVAQRRETCALYRVTEDGLKFLEQVTGTKLTWAGENTEAPVCSRCRNWKRGVCTRGVVRLMPGEILHCALFHEKTHGDEIRGMTDRELALWMSCHCGCIICPIGKDGCDDTDRDHGCPEHLLEWLRAPVGGER